MPASDSKSTEPKKMPGIFISYRRSDTPDAVGRIYDRLIAEFGKSRVFKDVDSIPLGQDFRGHLNDIVGGCAAVLAIIGPRWADARNEAGQRRLEDPDDFVRIELEAALARKVPVVPVQVGHAPMPGSGQLPESLLSLIYRQAIEVRPDPDFHNDATRLVSALRLILDPNARVGTSPGHPLKWVAAFVAGAVIAAAALAFPALKYLRAAPPPETRTEIPVHSRIGSWSQIALSPDGRQIVYVETNDGTTRLWLRALAATTAQPLPGTEGGVFPFWSPDSRSIGFFTTNALKRLDVGGGAPLTLAQASFSQGGSWNSEGVILFSPAGKGIARVAATGGAVTQAVPVEKGVVTNAGPVFLPDGRRFLYLSLGGKSPGINLGSLDGKVQVRLSPSIGNIAYLPSGWLLIWDDAQKVLLAQRLDVDKAAVVGAPVILAQGSGSVSTSATGLVAYWKTGIAGGKRQLQWRNRTGAELGSLGEPDGTYATPRASPDGRRVAVSRGESGQEDIWLLEGERASRLTFSPGNGSAVWSPDGTRIVFGASPIGGAPGIYQKSADGAGEEQLLMKADLLAVPNSWSPDGRNLLYVYVGSGIDLGVLQLTGDHKSRVFLNAPFVEGNGEFSPDGKWVAYQSNESGQTQVYVRSFDEPGAADGKPGVNSGKWQVSTAGGISPKWSPDGRELFFLNPVGEMMAAPIAFTGSAVTPGTPAKLFQTRVVGGGTISAGTQYDVARDGRFLINAELESAASESQPIILIQNWNPDAKKQ